MNFPSILAIIFAASVDALTVHHARWTHNTSDAVTTDRAAQIQFTFQTYYESASGRGIWRWSNALEAYDRHFSMLVGKPLSVAEVGVQSGGSLLMWRSVLGPQIRMYGLDINPVCAKFQDGLNVDITIGDQGDWHMWQAFFAKVGSGIDVLVDDGSHQPQQMLTTLFSAFPNIKPGGYIGIEDIFGPHYLPSLLKPAATFLAQRALLGSVHSVHLYPGLMVIRKGGEHIADTLTLYYPERKIPVTDVTAMWTAITTAPGGSQIVLQNPTWNSFFNKDSLTNLFTSFNDLHLGSFKDTPSGCSTRAADVCTNEISPMTHLQSRVSGVHIYKDRAVIEVPAVPPRIAATRKGTEWIWYP